MPARQLLAAAQLPSPAESPQALRGDPKLTEDAQPPQGLPFRLLRSQELSPRQPLDPDLRLRLFHLGANALLGQAHPHAQTQLHLADAQAEAAQGVDDPRPLQRPDLLPHLQGEREHRELLLPARDPLRRLLEPQDPQGRLGVLQPLESDPLPGLARQAALFPHDQQPPLKLKAPQPLSILLQQFHRGPAADSSQQRPLLPGTRQLLEARLQLHGPPLELSARKPPLPEQAQLLDPLPPQDPAAQTPLTPPPVPLLSAPPLALTHALKVTRGAHPKPYLRRLSFPVRPSLRPSSVLN